MTKTLNRISIKALYPLALAEGEGVGTAYEYYAKRLVLRGWLSTLPSLKRIIIQGLPEKYGSSLDFFYLAWELGAELTVVDERPQALTKAEHSLAAAQKLGLMADFKPTFTHIQDPMMPVEVTPDFDLCLASEVMQRFEPAARADYWAELTTAAPAVALFAPNGDNKAHTEISGLAGVRLAELVSLTAGSEAQSKVGYIDMPPFPPGITRSESQRTQAESGLIEGAAMWGLGFYAQLEIGWPQKTRRRLSHIVYTLSSR